MPSWGMLEAMALPRVPWSPLPLSLEDGGRYLGGSLEEAICSGKQRGQAGMHLEPHSLGELSRGQEALDFR